MKVTHLLIILLISFLQASCSDIVSAMKPSPFEDNPGKRSSGIVIDDRVLETKSKVNLKKASSALDAANIDVNSYNGIVLLSGQVDSEQMKELAGKVITDFRHVRKLHNHLKVAGKTSTLSRGNDVWLATKIKTKMLVNTNIQSHRVKVVAENGTVFLMGLLTREEGKIATDIARKSGGIQKVVVLFEYIN